MSKRSKLNKVLFVITCLVLLIELFRDTFVSIGDFKGYVLAGNLVLQGENIYDNPLLNTWPPFFSLVSVPIALLDNFNSHLSRFVWLLGLLAAMYAVVNYTTKLILKKEFKLNGLKAKNALATNSISPLNSVVLVPLIISLRYIMDNMSNIQINILMLFFALASIYLFVLKKEILAAFILAFSISIKVYTVFLLLFFLFKREYKMAGLTILFCILFSLIPFVFFGFEQTLDYYSFWYEHNVKPFASVIHKNQSYFSMMRSLLTHESPGVNQPLNEEIYINILNLSIENVKRVSYGVLILFALPVLYFFRSGIKDRSNLKNLLQFVLVLSVVPILSPLAWKAYFIFLFPGYFVNYLFLFQFENTLSRRVLYTLRGIYLLSVLFTVFSSELFVGGYFSDILELFSIITIGTILLVVNVFMIYLKYDYFIIQSWVPETSRQGSGIPSPDERVG